MFIRFFFLSLSVVLLNACYYDVEEELYGNVCIDLPATYSGAVLEVLQVNCYQCHSAETNFGDVNLEGYEQLKIYVDNGSFVGTIDHMSGFSAMPQDRPKMLECDINLIKSWVDNGALNN